MMLLGIDWFVVEDSSRKAKLVVSLYVVGFCFMYNIHDVHPYPFFLIIEKGTLIIIKQQNLLFRLVKK